MVVGPLGVIVGIVGAGKTLIVNGADVDLHPVAVSVTVTVNEKEPGVPKDCVRHCVVVAFTSDQRYV